MNNGKYHTKSFRDSQAAKVDRLYGPIEDHNKICQCCGKVYVWTGRKHTKAHEASKFCSRSCANSTGGKAKATKHHGDSVAHYRTVAFRYRDKHCYACGHNRIIEVHHLDGNHSNNDPSNLIPLCPTHHKMVHSRWKNEVEELLANKKFWGV